MPPHVGQLRSLSEARVRSELAGTYTCTGLPTVIASMVAASVAADGIAVNGATAWVPAAPTNSNSGTNMADAQPICAGGSCGVVMLRVG